MVSRKTLIYFKMIYLTFVLCFLKTITAQNVVPTFPDDFVFGVGTSSYQTEGAWNTDGKGWSMWDHLVRTNPNAIKDNSNGDVACNSYHLYKHDIEMLKQLKVQAYRFSISWPRILPYGRPDYVNPTAVNYYNELINELLAYNITPFVTMYHWDLPQNLNERGGWLNEEIVDWFGDYARVLYENFGDRVRHWLTINEPHIHCKLGYGMGIHAPGIKSPGTGFYDCGRHILLANARAYHIYDDEFRAAQNGQVGLVFDINWVEPATDSQDDADAVTSYITFVLGQYADPIFSSQGNYPQLLIDRVAAASVEQGYNSSRLRSFTEDEVNYIKGSADIFALNTYGTDTVYRNESLEGMYEIPSVSHDAYYGVIDGQFVPLNGTHDLRDYVPGFYKLLTYIKDQYNNPPLYVTENGLSMTESGLADDDRVSYIRNYLTALYVAKADGANIEGYLVWSLMDDFGWNHGYTIKMGLYEVNMSDPNRARTPRKSALVYTDIVRNREIDYTYNPDPYDTSKSTVIKPYAILCGSLISIYLRTIH